MGGIELIDEDEYEEDLVPCPICKDNYIPVGQDMCDECRAKIAREESEEKEDEWSKEDEDLGLDDDGELSLDQMEEDEFDEDEEDED